MSKVNPSQTHNNMYAYGAGGVSFDAFLLLILLTNPFVCLSCDFNPHVWCFVCVQSMPVPSSQFSVNNDNFKIVF